MKKYIFPIMEVHMVAAADIMTASNNGNAKPEEFTNGTGAPARQGGANVKVTPIREGL